MQKSEMQTYDLNFKINNSLFDIQQTLDRSLDSNRKRWHEILAELQDKSPKSP